MIASTATRTHESHVTNNLFRVAALLALASGCAGVPVPKDKLTDPGALLFNGYANKDVDCYHCHNGDGSGTLRGPDLGKKVPTDSDEEIKKTILEGKAIMPSYKGKLSDEELGQLTTWLRATFGPPAQPKP
jgi:mono/diheme cytochrome c family protein